MATTQTGNDPFLNGKCLFKGFHHIDTIGMNASLCMIHIITLNQLQYSLLLRYHYNTGGKDTIKRFLDQSMNINLTRETFSRTKQLITPGTFFSQCRPYKCYLPFSKWSLYTSPLDHPQNDIFAASGRNCWPRCWRGYKILRNGEIRFPCSSYAHMSMKWNRWVVHPSQSFSKQCFLDK